LERTSGVSRPVVCSIGTTEGWNAAGLGLDLLALWECGARPVSIVAGVSAQDESGIRALFPLPAEAIAAQFAALSGARIAAFRIGALLDPAGVAAVAAGVAKSRAPIVYDPVLAASAGGNFADAATLAMIRSELLPKSQVLTPNAGEAALLLGGAKIAARSDLAGAAQALRALGARAVLITGGDLPGSPVDVLADADGLVEFEEERIPGDMRGTGCLLAAALAAGLARGVALRTAVREARAFVRTKLSAAERLGPFRVAY
jgi:hydroxymethylpyrimidine/phosphomethylpyrimidine kinase